MNKLEMELIDKNKKSIFKKTQVYCDGLNTDTVAIVLIERFLYNYVNNVYNIFLDGGDRTRITIEFCAWYNSRKELERVINNG